MDFLEKRTGGRTVYSGNLIKVRLDEIELPGGKPAQREVVEHSGGVAVAPLDAEGNLIMVRQFRYPFSTELLEVPAGKLTPGEDHLDCCVRELKEETGYTSGNLTYLGVIYVSPGFSNEVTHLYLARDLTAGESCPDEDEFLAVERMPFSSAVELVMTDVIHDAKTVAAILKTKILLGI